MRQLLVMAKGSRGANVLGVWVSCGVLLGAGTGSPVQGAALEGQIAGERSAEAWLALAARAYQASPIVEHVRFESLSTPTLRTDAWLRLDTGSEERPARMRIDAERAVVFAQGDRLVLAHADNPRTYAQLDLAGGLGEGLFRALPPTPLPQLALGFARADQPTSRWDMGRATWSSVTMREGVATLEGTLDGGPVSIMIDGEGRVLGYSVWAGGTTLRASVSRRDPEDPTTWVVALEGRTRVASTADLRALPARVEVGRAVPALGLMTGELVGWSLRDALASAREATYQPSRVAGAIVLVSPGASGSTLDAALRAFYGASRAARSFDAQHSARLAHVPKLLVRMACPLDLKDVSRERVAEVATRWRSAAGQRPLPDDFLLWTGGGMETLHQFAPEQSAALVLIDDRQELLGVVPLEGSLLDEQAIEQEVRLVMDAGK